MSFLPSSPFPPQAPVAGRLRVIADFMELRGCHWLKKSPGIYFGLPPQIVLPDTFKRNNSDLKLNLLFK